MRLTVELIQNSLSYINPLKDRELDLRGHKIPSIENLGIAKDQDAIDFTDNDISSLGNFPFFPRLHTLLLARNRVRHIQPTLASSIPSLSTLVLTANNIAELADLDPLRNFTGLAHLTLLENPITRKEHYRYWVIWRIPSVRVLDYQKVKNAEREKAQELFGTAEEPSPLASKIIGIKSHTFDVPSGGAADRAPADKAVRVKLTEKERKRVEKMIREAKSLQEITRLEKELNEGRIPGGALGYEDSDDDKMEIDPSQSDKITTHAQKTSSPASSIPNHQLSATLSTDLTKSQLSPLTLPNHQTTYKLAPKLPSNRLTLLTSQFLRPSHPQSYPAPSNSITTAATMPPNRAPPPAPWRPLFDTHLKASSTSSFTFTTVLHSSSQALPRARTCELRGFWPSPPLHPLALSALSAQGIALNPPVYESDMISLTTDARMDKIAQLDSSERAVEALFWLKDVGAQWRIKGKAYVVGDLEEGKEEEEEARRRVLAGMRSLSSGSGGLEGEWSWERQVTAYFANHSPIMRGSFKSPPPGQPRSQVPDDPELKPGQKVDDLLDPVARRNFRVVVIYPEEVERLDLSDLERVRRTKWVFVEGDNGGGWEEVELWP